MDKNMELQHVADSLEALGNETRLAIFTLLVPAGLAGKPVGDIQRALQIPGSTLSHHIARLVQVGLVRQEREGRSLICKANYPSMDRVVEFLTQNCCEADGCHAPHKHDDAEYFLATGST